MQTGADKQSQVRRTCDNKQVLRRRLRASPTAALVFLPIESCLRTEGKDYQAVNMVPLQKKPEKFYKENWKMPTRTFNMCMSSAI